MACPETGREYWEAGRSHVQEWDPETSSYVWVESVDVASNPEWLPVPGAWNHDVEYSYGATSYLRAANSGPEAGWAVGCRPPVMIVRVFIPPPGEGGTDNPQLYVRAWSDVDQAYEDLCHVDFEPYENGLTHEIVLNLDWDGLAEHYSLDEIEMGSHLYPDSGGMLLYLEAGPNQIFWTAYQHTEEL